MVGPAGRRDTGDTPSAPHVGDRLEPDPVDPGDVAGAPVTCKGKENDAFIETTETKIAFSFNPLVPRVQKIKIRNLALNRLLIVEFVKKMVYLGAHYSERQGLIS